MVKTSVIYYGNLQSYKFFLRPTGLKQYGRIKDKSLTKHQKMVQNLLKTLALNESLTTWELAKRIHHDNLDKVRTKEKKYRRLLLGRSDRNKRSKGILQLGLVVTEQKMYRNRPTASYRLSLHGILYCIDALEFDNKEIDTIASKYAHILPRVFGKWKKLKKSVGDDVYCLRILSKGLLMDNPQFGDQLIYPVYEIMAYLNIFYKKYFDFITETDLAEQISSWFFSFMLFSLSKKSNNLHDKKTITKLKKIFRDDQELKNWFMDLVCESSQYYYKRAMNLRTFSKDFQELI